MEEGPEQRLPREDIVRAMGGSSGDRKRGAEEMLRRRRLR
jgi:hypothetical protein